MMHTVKQVANLAGVTPRTLHYYDEIGLLRPSLHGENGYRFYGEEAILRLQQILFYRELGLNLGEIRRVLDRPDFDVLQALEAHKRALERKAQRLRGLIATIEKTILHMKGQIEMSTQGLFDGFDDETQAHYEEQAAQRWGEKYVKESRRRWNKYTAEEKSRIFVEAGEVYRGLVERMGRDPSTDEVQSLVARWHQNLRHFYEPTREILLGLAEGYSQDPAFADFFRKMHPELPEFLRRAIEHYCRVMPEADQSPSHT
jgi:DNA-binding transcriptional MerR regulator